jgi:hypothetical protein
MVSNEKRITYGFSRACSERLSQFGVCEQLVNSRRQSALVTYCNKQSGFPIVDDLLRSRRRRSDDRYTACHRFNDRDTEGVKLRRRDVHIKRP